MTNGRGGGRGGRGMGQGMGRGRGGGRGARQGMGRRGGQGMGRNSGFGAAPGSIPFEASASTDQRILESLAEALGNKVQAITTRLTHIKATKTESSVPRDRNQGTISGGEKRIHRIAVIDKEVCMGCGICANICPENAVIFMNAMPMINPNRCNGCGVCVDQCPDGAISLSELKQAVRA